MDVFATVTAAIHIAPDGACRDTDGGAIGHRTELGAAIHITLDDGGAFRLVDGQEGFLHLGQVRPHVIGGTVQQGETTHGRGKHVTALGMFDEVIFRLVVVTDGAALDVDRDDTIVVAIPHVTIVRIGLSIGKGRCGKLSAHRSHTTATVDGAEHFAAFDIEGDVAAHHTGGEGVAREATTAAEHVAVNIRIAPGTDVDVSIRLFDGEIHIVQHVAILAATEHGAEDGAAGDVHFNIIHEGPSVEQDARVAHACAEEVAGDGVSGDGVEGTGHAQGAALHVDGTLTLDVGDLVTAIDAGEDMTTIDVDGGVAVHLTGGASPDARRHGIETATATEHVTEVRVSVGTLCGTALGIISVSELIVNIIMDFVFCVLNAVRPGVALMELSGDGVDGVRIFGLYSRNGCLPQMIFTYGIDGIPVMDPYSSFFALIVTNTDLTAVNIHHGVVQNQTVFAAAIDGGRDERRMVIVSAIDRQMRAADHTHSDDLGILDGVHFTFTAAENPTEFIVARIVGGRHQRLVDDTHTSTVKGHCCQTGIVRAANGDMNHYSCVVRIIGRIGNRLSGKRTH